MSAADESPPPGFERWVETKIHQHGWGLEELLVVRAVLEGYEAVMREHEPSVVGAAGMLSLLRAIDEGDLDGLREAGRQMREDAVSRALLENGAGS